MDLELPKTFGGAVRWFLTGTVIFALGFEGVSKLLEGKLLVSLGSFVSALILLALIVYWDALSPEAITLLVVIAASPIIFYATVKICRRLKMRGGMLLNIGIILIFVALLTALVGGGLIYVGSMAAIEAGREPPPSGEATRLKSELDAKNRELDDVKKQLAARPIPGATPNSSPPPISQPTFANYDLTEAQIRELATGFFEIRDSLPATIDIQRMMYDAPSMALSQQLFRSFQIAGIQSQLNWNRPIDPDDTGISIRVANLRAPVAIKLRDIIKKVVGVAPRIVESKGMNPDVFMIFVGQKPAQ